MSATEPWEKRNMTYARAYSGEWWIPDAQQFKLWYGWNLNHGFMHWFVPGYQRRRNPLVEKPLDVVPGTNIVIDTVLKSNNVWYDHEDANASRRYKLADTGGGPQLAVRLWQLLPPLELVHWCTGTWKSITRGRRLTVQRCFPTRCGLRVAGRSASELPENSPGVWAGRWQATGDGCTRQGAMTSLSLGKQRRTWIGYIWAAKGPSSTALQSRRVPCRAS